MRPSQKRQMFAFTVAASGLVIVVASVCLVLTQECCAGFVVSAFLGAILILIGFLKNARESERIRSRGYQ